MGWYPYAVRKNIPPTVNDPRIVPDTVVDHVAASEADSLYGWFRQSGGIESHFYIRYSGVVEQYRDTLYQADAQLGAGKDAISIETQGLGNGLWTDEQIKSLLHLHKWIAIEHRIPRKRVTSPSGVGLGYHSMFNEWTGGDGRTCPGPKRIEQWTKQLLPAFVAIDVPPKPVVIRFPLPSGHWFGVDDGTPYSHSGIRGGTDDDNIKRIQRKLNAYLDINLSVDGDFGPKTHRAVIRYQTARQKWIADHKVNGKVGRNTWNDLFNR